MSDLFLISKSSKKRLRVHQMCNDWITAYDAETGDMYKKGQPLNPKTVRFEPESIQGVLDMQEAGKLGTMFTDDFDLGHFKETGEFKVAKSERVKLTYDQAVAMLPDGDMIHTFMNPNGGMLIGADHSRESILNTLKTGRPELAGEAAKSMGHGIVVFLKVVGNDLYDPLFIQTKEDENVESN